MSTAYAALRSVTDHDVTLTITGDVESLRPRLSEALQRLGYSLLSEQPLYAKRSAKGGARWDCSFEVLDYPTKLTILLKQINEISVVATFNYEVKSYKHMTKGDRQTLAREAEAIAALASERLSISACPSCATPVVDDSHFCRRCGTPLVVEVAELEVLRLTRKSRTAYHNLMFGVVTLFVASLILLPLFWADPKLSRVLLIIGPAFGTFGLFALLQGLWQLHFALNPPSTREVSARTTPVFAAPHTQALPSMPSGASVTDATTELLVPSIENEKRRPSEPIPRKPLDTGEVTVHEVSTTSR
jgi:hypothetical protein